MRPQISSHTLRSSGSCVCIHLLVLTSMSSVGEAPHPPFLHLTPPKPSSFPCPCPCPCPCTSLYFFLHFLSNRFATLSANSFRHSLHCCSLRIGEARSCTCTCPLPPNFNLSQTRYCLSDSAAFSASAAVWPEMWRRKLTCTIRILAGRLQG